MVHTTVIERLACCGASATPTMTIAASCGTSASRRKKSVRAMGCKVDDPGALALELSQLEVARWRKFLPQVAAARGPRIGIDINVTAREFGSALVWFGELRGRRAARRTASTADCPEIWRGEVEGSWITRRRFELPIDPAHGLSRDGGENRRRDCRPCLLIIAPPRCYEPASIIAGRRLWASPCSCIRCGRGTTGVSGISTTLDR